MTTEHNAARTLIVHPSMIILTFMLVVFITACSSDSGDRSEKAGDVLKGSVPLALRPVPASLPAPEREAVRKLPMDGPGNFRDIGGYPTVNGRRVKWGLLYRADSLSKLSETDQAYFEKLGIKSIVDFRSNEERENEPDNINSTSIEMRSIPIAAGKPSGLVMAMRLLKLLTDKEQATSELKTLLVGVNRQLIEDNTQDYRLWMPSLLSADSYPMVFHCSAGKDRTGIAAVLVLLALGVDKEIAIEDYMATNRYIDSQVDQLIKRINSGTFGLIDAMAIKPTLTVDRRYIEEAIITMERQYGSIDNYLLEGLGIDKEKQQALQKLLLES